MFLITISGSLQKALKEIRTDIIEFQKLGCTVLSPRMFLYHQNEGGFVILDSDGNRKPAVIHSRHVISIKQSRFLWVRNPAGYVGPSTALEIGYAHALGIPIFASDEATDRSMNQFLKVVSSPKKALELYHKNKLASDKNISKRKNIQTSISYMAFKCGFDTENDERILELLDEEIAELKESISNNNILFDEPHSIAEEIADCVIYLYHLANQTGVDLNRSVYRKIAINLMRWSKRSESA